MKSAISFAHSLWKQWVLPNDNVVDATCGNGHDTAFLAALVPLGKVHAFDVQEIALKNTHNELHAQGLLERVHLYRQSHAQFPVEIALNSLRLVVYNLGYLPGGNKQLTTQTASTLESIQNALPLLLADGVISITLYPGYPEGLKEQETLLAFAHSLPPQAWVVNHIQWLNRKAAPSLLLISSSKRES